MNKSSKFKVQSSKFKIIFLLSTVYCLLSTAVFAEEKTVTLAEASRLAVASYESVKMSEEDLRQAGDAIDKAISQMLPNITANGNYTKYSESKTSGGFNTQPENNSSFDVTLTQSLYSGGKEWSLWRQAKRNTESGNYGLDVTKEEVILNVSNLYYSILKAEKTMEIKEAALKRAMEQRRVAVSRFQVGDATKAIVLRAEADVAGAEADLTTAKKDLVVARDKLARFLGISEEFKVIDPHIQPIPDASLDKLVALSLEKRRDYIQSKLGEEIADEAIDYARGNFLPSLKLEGVYSWKDQSPKTTFFNEESIYGGITFTYPLFEGGLRLAELNEAKSKRRQAEFKRISLRKDIEVAVKEAFHNLEAYNSIIESFKRQVSFAEENYNMVFKQFTYGLSTNVDVIDANATLVSSQSNLSNAQYDYQAAILALKKSVGILLEDMMEGK
ncbi:MAG: TolC family protein [Deltaproteobacteria bacterium]|nr:TolC family protein [Deltaproteobacteria bacterium]